MRSIGIFLAVVVLIGVVAGIGYGAVSGYKFLSVQWQSLSNEWRAILIVVATIAVVCTLFASLSIQSSIRKYGLNGSGRVMAYNDFAHWYSALKNNSIDATKADRVRALANQMMLWGSKPVAKQATHLYALLQDNSTERDQLLDKAEHVYIEIRRDLGLRGVSSDNAIV